MAIQLLRFRDGKETEFEEAILHFASDRYHSAVTRTWKVMVAHVDSAAWIDLFRVSRHSAMEAGAEDWPECDAWSLTWDILTPSGWIHTPQPVRKQLVTRLELDSFDKEIASRAPQYDLVTFLQDELLHCFANLRRMPDYILHVLTHEVLHSCSDWARKTLVIDGVPPPEDKETVATLDAFIRHLGGWHALRQRYLL
jgi:hypothetical protein